MNWLEVSLTVDGELAESVAEVLSRFAPNGVTTEQGVRFLDEEDEGTGAGPITVRAYLEVNEQLEQTRQKLEESLYYLGMIQPVPAPVYKQIADQNWMEAWKEHYRPIPIGRRLVIVPAWLDPPEPGRTAIRIDPGMAFGTGTHPTTQLCLELLERFFDEDGEGDSSLAALAQNDTVAQNDTTAQNDAGSVVLRERSPRPIAQRSGASRSGALAPRSGRTSVEGDSSLAALAQNDTVAQNDMGVNVIDVGCGSGILSIAALKLGAQQVLGVDIDMESVKNSRENADLNGIGGELMLGQGSVAEVLAGGFAFRSARLVLANILAPIIIRLFDAGLADLAEPGGTLILSGILADQEGRVVTAAEAKGLKLVDRRQTGDWVALRCRK